MKANDYIMRDKRFIRCRECGLEWNIGKWDKVPKFGYICPECSTKKKHKNTPSAANTKGQTK